MEAKNWDNREMDRISDSEVNIERQTLVRKEVAFSHQHFVAQVHLMVNLARNRHAAPGLGDVKMSLAWSSWPRGGEGEVEWTQVLSATDGRTGRRGPGEAQRR